MNLLEKLLELLGVAVCTIVVPAGADSPNVSGSVITHIEQGASEFETSSRSLRHISLQGVDPKRYSKLDSSGSELDYSKGIIPFNSSASAVELETNVPVLDQGQYGTCVTFSTTAALDAVLGIGDGISQQCTLELNLALGNNYWNGADDSTQIILPLQTYGAVPQGKCGGTVYPHPSKIVSLSAYKGYVSKDLQVSSVQHNYYPDISLANVQSALNLGHYVTIGFGLLNNGNVVSVQGYDANVSGLVRVGGLWACNQPPFPASYCGTPTAGHEVLIVGYDDMQQLLKIQNSWGVNVADSGYFYMTYEFFESMAGDGTEVW
jgi:hypothetical protein